LDKILTQLSNLYPDIEWGIAEPNDDVLENFGNGMILFGKKGEEVKDFFILEHDKRKLQWGHVIANYLNQTVKEEIE
jgi:hypothetical protein